MIFFYLCAGHYNVASRCTDKEAEGKARGSKGEDNKKQTSLNAWFNSTKNDKNDSPDSDLDNEDDLPVV